MKINQNNVYEIISEAELSFHKCFLYLLSLKNMDGTHPEEITLVEFQPTLADALYKLMSFYQTLNQFERSIIERKSSYKYSWFSNRMKKIHSYKEAISSTIEIGKELGDAFVWAFYENNIDELEKHLSHQKTGLFTAGIGGFGEIEFIKNNPVLYGCFVIYHGISSMLRIGDFSLYSHEHGIIAFGELKSSKKDSNITVRAFITSKMDLGIERDESKRDIYKAFDMTDIVNPDRLRRQIKDIERLLEQRKCDIEKHIHSDNMSYLLNTANKSKQTIILNTENNIIVIGLRSPCASLAKNLLGTPLKIAPPSNIAEKVLKIMKPSSQCNRIIMVELSHEMQIGRTPIFWWDVEPTVIRELIFRQLLVLTVFNPVSLYEHYAEQGFSIIEEKDGEILFEKSIDSKKITIGNITSFIDLITNNFITPLAVIRIIDKTLEDIYKSDITENTKFQLYITPKEF